MSAEPILARVRQIVATTFEVPLDHVTAETSPATLEKWDSMGHLMLILEIEQEFNVQLRPEQAEQLTSVQSIVNVLEAA